MERELYIGVDVSKRWLDLAYYDGVSVDWKQGHIRVDNKESGFVQMAPCAYIGDSGGGSYFGGAICFSFIEERYEYFLKYSRINSKK